MAAFTHYKKNMVNRFIAEQEEPLDLSIRRHVYECISCPATFNHLDRLKAHLRRHKIKESGRYTCKICDKKFVQQSSLITHMRIHTGERPFHCDICENTYGDLSTFTKHKRIHSGEKPYGCNLCQRKFSQSGNCLRHIRSVHKKLKQSKSVSSSPSSGSSSPCYTPTPSNQSMSF